MMDLSYSNQVLDRKIEQLKECNREIELMIQTIDSDNSSRTSESSSFIENYDNDDNDSYYYDNKKIKIIDPRFFENYQFSSNSQKFLMHDNFRSQSAFDNFRDYNDEMYHKRNISRNEPNKAKITFRMNRAMIPKPPKVIINKNTQQKFKPMNNLQKEFQNKIDNQTAEFVDRCMSAPFRHNYGSLNELRPSKSAIGPSYSKSKTSGPKSLSTSKKKPFLNLNAWVPNGKIKRPLSSSLSNLSDFSKSVESKKSNKKNEKIKQLETNWKPAGKLREKSATRESVSSLKESIDNEKQIKKKFVEERSKEMEKGWKPAGKLKETPYPKKVPIETEKKDDEIKEPNKEDEKLKELERGWKTAGKPVEPFVPFKSIEIKNELITENDVDIKKLNEEKKLKELESNWKPAMSGTKIKTSLSMNKIDANEPLKSISTNEKPPKADKKIKEMENNWNKPPLPKKRTPVIKNKPENIIKPNVKPKVINKKLVKQSTVTIKNEQNDSIPIRNSTPSKNQPLIDNNELIENVEPVEQSTINGSASENKTENPEELEQKADNEFENDIKYDLMSKNKDLIQTSTPKREKNSELVDLKDDIEEEPKVDNTNKPEENDVKKSEINLNDSLVISKSETNKESKSEKTENEETVDDNETDDDDDDDQKQAWKLVDDDE